MNTPNNLEWLKKQVHSFAEDIADAFGGDIDEHPQAEYEEALCNAIATKLAEARIEERSLALMYLHGTNREQDYLRKLANNSSSSNISNNSTLNGVKNK